MRLQFADNPPEVAAGPRPAAAGSTRGAAAQAHLTYCLNVHPGEEWDACLGAIRTHALAVRDRVAPDKPFGLGLRLSAIAADELAQPARLDEFKRLLADNGLYVFTVNGFPYGHFHGTAVKDAAYSPDWTSRHRMEYTRTLASVLAGLLPAGMTGSISTVPLTYRPWARGDDAVAGMVAHLAQCAAHLAELARDGRQIVLSLEPEPDCLLETTDDVLAFFQRWDGLAVKEIQRQLGGVGDDAMAVWRRHVGVCLDAAHSAVQFEQPIDALNRLCAAGIRVGKIQFSAGLESRLEPEALRRLSTFAESTYLHQTRVRHADGAVEKFPDLGAFLDSCKSPAGNRQSAVARVHFHVPLFWRGDSMLGSTADDLRGRFAAAIRRGACEHLEIETYTWNVMPEALRPGDIDDAIAREFQWVLELLAPAGVR